VANSVQRANTKEVNYRTTISNVVFNADGCNDDAPAFQDYNRILHERKHVPNGSNDAAMVPPHVLEAARIQKEKNDAMPPNTLAKDLNSYNFFFSDPLLMSEHPEITTPGTYQQPWPNYFRSVDRDHQNKPFGHDHTCASSFIPRSTYDPKEAALEAQKHGWAHNISDVSKSNKKQDNRDRKHVSATERQTMANATGSEINTGVDRSILQRNNPHKIALKEGNVNVDLTIAERQSPTKSPTKRSPEKKPKMSAKERQQLADNVPITDTYPGNFSITDPPQHKVIVKDPSHYNQPTQRGQVGWNCKVECYDDTTHLSHLETLSSAKVCIRAKEWGAMNSHRAE